MPTIEMYGLDERDLQRANDQLVATFRDTEYASEMVISGIRSGVRNLQGTLQPFFRVYVTTGKLESWLPDILERLESFPVDIEVMALHAFIPNKS